MGMQEIRNQRVTVAGLGRFGGGTAVARWLAEHGARVLVTDLEPAEKLADSVKQLDGLPIAFHLGGHREEDFTRTDLVVASPAIPPGSPYLAAAAAAGVPVTTEIRLFVERCPATILGVTGTKGKSTTTEMLGRMLGRRYQTWVGGNIGKSLLPELDHIDKTHLVVLELSSFMLHYLGQMRWSPHVALVTLLSQDHTRWHGSHDAYTDAKRNIVRFQRPDDVAVVNEECSAALELVRASAGRIVRFGIPGRRPFALALPGRHNQLNAQGAFAAAGVLGITWDEAAAALRDFTGLPHRLELVHEAAGVRYYNDSIATIPDAAIAALETFEPKRVIQIVGGKDKGIPFTSLCAALCERAKAAICIGSMGPVIADRLSESSSQRGAAVYRCDDLATAVKLAKSIAVVGDVVLLSTGYASYDQFSNFEERGEAFTKLVREEM
jgi:UDP-N-acetylmuramoylalanine--D-glutamate ligase